MLSPTFLDDFGLAPLDDEGRRDLLELLEERCSRRSTVITSQLPVASWHEAIGQATLADAILDRLVHNAYRIELSGESMRRIIHTRSFGLKMAHQQAHPIVAVSNLGLLAKRLALQEEPRQAKAA